MVGGRPAELHPSAPSFVEDNLTAVWETVLRETWMACFVPFSAHLGLLVLKYKRISWETHRAIGGTKCPLIELHSW